MNLTSFIAKNRSYLIGYCSTVILLGVLSLIIPKGTESIWLDKHRNPGLDFTFEWLTFIGDGWFLTIVSLFCVFFINYRAGIISAVLFIVTGVLAQFFKHFIFESASRPVVYVMEKYNVLLTGADGVELLNNFSYPSGHTTSAFALFTFIACNFKFKHGWIWAIPALIVAFSRVYLCEHFIIDIFAGAILGGMVSLIFIFFAARVKGLSGEKLQQKIFK
jgi:membrane-associated phospholipid phosphatase